ncbi:hypothetical protein SDC9_209627 [bioreactor metagenome]|uniref:Transmembrane protein n=1 Tax=bioreactor metagenome TaxID=1076179 RepID=A0A645JFA9_9ZZZZ
MPFYDHKKVYIFLNIQIQDIIIGNILFQFIFVQFVILCLVFLHLLYRPASGQFQCIIALIIVKNIVIKDFYRGHSILIFYLESVLSVLLQISTFHLGNFPCRVFAQISAQDKPQRDIILGVI